MTLPIPKALSGVLAGLLDGTPDFAVVVATPEGVIEGWLGAAERLIGYTAEEAIGHSLSIFFTEEDRARGLDRHEIAVARVNGRSEDDRWLLRKDSSRFWASGVLTAVRGDDGSLIALCKVLRDKTDVIIQIHALESKVQARDARLAADSALLRSTVHELRNPLMPIVSSLALLHRSDATHLHGRAIAVLDAQVALLRKLLDDLDAAAAVAGATQITLDRVEVCLTDSLRVIVDGLLGAAHERHQHLSLVLPPTEIRILADPARVQQMLLNLVGNACKYTPDGGRICVGASIEAQMAVVRVEDDGIGISAEVLPFIFDLFTREGRQPDIAGAGVGLAVVRQLASLHGGSVDVRSPGPGKGSIFTLRLPLLDPVLDDPGSFPSAPAPPAPA